MRAVWAMLLTLTSCAAPDTPQVIACEKDILNELPDASSYWRVRVWDARWDGRGDKPWMNKRWQAVRIVYNAGDIDGVPARGIKDCSYPIDAERNVRIDVYDDLGGGPLKNLRNATGYFSLATQFPPRPSTQ